MRPLFKAVGLILIAMFSIQFGASLAKQIFPIAGPAGLTALRVTISALILCLFARVWKHKISWSDLPMIAAYGLSLGFMNLLFYFSLEKIPLGVAVALEFVGPLSVALLYSKNKWDFLWVLLAGVGIYLILPSGNTPEALNVHGVLLALGAGFFWALYIVFGKAAAKRGESMHISALGMVFAAAVALPAGIIFNGAEIQNLSLLPQGFMIAILSSALPYSLEMKAMKDMPAKTFGVLMSMEPAVATLMGILILKEVLTLWQWVAIACVIVASAGSSLTASASRSSNNS
ncbi:MAG TPA: DMT family transporter [Bdellovibrio sp.]